MGSKSIDWWHRIRANRDDTVVFRPPTECIDELFATWGLVCGPDKEVALVRGRCFNTRENDDILNARNFFKNPCDRQLPGATPKTIKQHAAVVREHGKRQ
jgi:hypothetical protein